jgi:hypothetical protein
MFVMAGLVPAIHVFLAAIPLRRGSPGMTNFIERRTLNKSHSFYFRMACENAFTRTRRTKEFCEIAAAVISPSYLMWGRRLRCRRGIKQASFGSVGDVEVGYRS